MSRKTWWDPGRQTALAKVAGLSRQNLSDILHRRRGVSVKRSFALERAAAKLGLDIPWNAWVGNRSTNHPAFFGKSI